MRINQLEERMSRSATFLIAHGAWTGAWSWRRVIDLLTGRGHRVHVPTLSGLCERSHLAKVAPISLSTHVSDIVNEATWNDLDGLVLVGHSYGGFVIAGAAERLGGRIDSIVFLEAFIPKDGQCFSDLGPGETLSEPSVPPPPSAKGEYRDDEDRKWVVSKVTPQPTATFTERLRVTGAYLQVPKKTFIEASRGVSAETAASLRRDSSWTVHQIDSGHDVPVDRPLELAQLLEDAI
jgi:pimeloyl-ACP methyl ester carboxylesterase